MLSRFHHEENLGTWTYPSRWSPACVGLVCDDQNSLSSNRSPVDVGKSLPTRIRYWESVAIWVKNEGRLFDCNERNLCLSRASSYKNALRCSIVLCLSWNPPNSGFENRQSSISCIGSLFSRYEFAIWGKYSNKWGSVQLCLNRIWKLSAQMLTMVPTLPIRPVSRSGGRPIAELHNWSGQDPGSASILWKSAASFPRFGNVCGFCVLRTRDMRPEPRG